MPNQKQPDFSPEEKAQIQRHGKALLGEPTDFDEAVEAHLADYYPHEAGFKKMHPAQTGGGDVGLGPSGMARAAIQGRDAAQQAAAVQGEQKAVQAQGVQAPVNAPPAPTGPAGVSTPYPAQSAPQPPPSATEALPKTTPPPPETPGEEEPPPQ